MLPDAVELVKAVKRAALEAVESSKPVNVYFGRVVAVSPLQINVEQKMTLGSAQLVLTRNVTDYETEVTVEWETEKMDEHVHELTGKKQMKIHNALSAGDEVVLIRMQEGQKYIVIDRLG